MSNRPIDSFDDYPVGISLYERESENGKWLNADVSKTYKDGDTYKKSRNFSRSDLLKLNALVPQAIARMQEYEQQQRQNSNSNEEKDGLEGVKADAQRHLNSQSENQTQGQSQ